MIYLFTYERNYLLFEADNEVLHFSLLFTVYAVTQTYVAVWSPNSNFTDERKVEITKLRKRISSIRLSKKCLSFTDASLYKYET